MFQKKSLGQNFLTSPQALEDILSAGKVTKGDIVLEVGPGEGVLTAKLLASGAHVIAVEKDDRLIPLLEKKFVSEREAKTFTLIHGDILSFEPEDHNLTPHTFKVIANIPYYITGEFFRMFLEKKMQPSLMVIMVQKEVAERIVTKDSKESILSLSVKAYGKPAYISTVKRGSFNPPPNVDSAILAITDISKHFFVGFDEGTFFKIIKTAFSQKRKKMSGNLKILFSREVLNEAFALAEIEEGVRAEDVELSKWGVLVKSLRGKENVN